MLGVQFIWSYWVNNIQSALEYRFSFVSQVLGMMINNTLWVVFWILYFKRFPVLKGWEVQDLVILWAVITFSFGLCVAFCGNLLRLPEMIVQGQLDYYLALPKNVLLHLSVSHLRTTNLGDVFFGPLMLILMVPLTPLQWVCFFVGSSLAAVVYYSFFLIIGSLSFFIGNSESLSASLTNALVHFTTYPTRIFDGATRVILFTLLPAGFIAELPIELVRGFHMADLLSLGGAAVLFFGISVGVFYMGLRRYESGNLFVMRQ